jgi:hypothetical protein
MAGKYGSFVGNSNGNEAPKLNITPNDLKSVSCENCQGEVFAEGVVLKTISALLTGNGKEGIMPIPAFYCVKCQLVVDRFLPEDMRKVKISG